jgi:hypothetical protein
VVQCLPGRGSPPAVSPASSTHAAATQPPCKAGHSTRTEHHLHANYMAASQQLLPWHVLCKTSTTACQFNTHCRDTPSLKG